MPLDYDRYAEGEALLGWLNCTAGLSSNAPFDANTLLLDLTTRIRDRLREDGFEIAHLKATLDARDRAGSLCVISLVGSDCDPDLRESLADRIRSGRLIVNLRADHVQPGSLIFLDDGVMELRVVKTAAAQLDCEITRGGRLEDRRGVNIPDASFGYRPMSHENRQDLLFAIDHDIEYIAASFVRSARNVSEINQLLEDHGAQIPVIAKIENKEAVQNLDEIVAVSNGTMVARGDLGVELPLHQIPMVQKKIIRTTVRAGKPVITATQMLDSMERHPIPTRAEVSDVANAILDGTSAVMLSGETAIGAYPVEAVRTMASLAREAEGALSEYGDLQNIRSEPTHVVTEAVSQAAITMADHLEATAIITLTESGFTSRSISKFRPRCPILAVSASEKVVRKLALNWGVTAILYQRESGVHDVFFRST